MSVRPPTVTGRWGLALAVSVAVHTGAFVVAVGLLSKRAPPTKLVAGPARDAVFTRVGLYGASRRAPAMVAAGSPSLARARPRPPGMHDSVVAPAASGALEREGGGATPLAPGEPVAEARPGGDGVSSEEGAAGFTGAGLSAAAAGSPGEAAAPSQADLNALVHAQLARLAERCYPPAARRFRQEGVVGVRFCVDEVGAVKSSELVQSSSSPLLDGAATGCVVQQAAPFVAAAYGRCFAVPVHFATTR